jgi:hypothetical protein
LIVIRKNIGSFKPSVSTYGYMIYILKKDSVNFKKTKFVGVSILKGGILKEVKYTAAVLIS